MRAEKSQISIIALPGRLQSLKTRGVYQNGLQRYIHIMV